MSAGTTSTQECSVIVHVRPDLFAHQSMKEYMSVIAEEVVHITICISTKVTRRSTQKSHLELPVIFNNRSASLTPKTRVITSTGTAVDCSPLISVMYLTKGGWISLTPLPAAVTLPQTLEPLSQSEWHYMDAEYLASSRIYTEKDLVRLREHIMSPVEHPTRMKNFAKATAGYRVPLDGLSINNLLDEVALSRIAGTTDERLWGGFLKFGTAAAGFIGIWLIIKAIKVVADTIIHRYALHSVYRWSVHLLDTIFSSVTNLLLHFGGRKVATQTTSRRAQSKDNVFESGASTQTMDSSTIVPQLRSTHSMVQARSTPTLYPSQQTELAIINESLATLE